MRPRMLLLAASLLSGCYTSAAVGDLATRHPPSLVVVERSAEGATLRVMTEHGERPSDVVLSEWMPDRHVRTHAATTHTLVPAAAACGPIVTTSVDPYGAPDVRQGREAEVLGEPPRPVYVRGPFPRRLSDLPYRLSTDPSTCWIVATYGTDETEGPHPVSLRLLGESEELQEIQLPAELGVASWRRWLRLPVAPLLDAAGFVIVPTEWIHRALTR